MKKILITGAGGFIGSFLVEKSLEKNYNTWAGIRQTTSKEFLKDENINFIDIPFPNKKDLIALLNNHKQQYGKWDVIINKLGRTK